MKNYIRTQFQRLTAAFLMAVLVFNLFAAMAPTTVSAMAEEQLVEEKAFTVEDLMAGTATVEDVYGVLDRSTVPDIIGYEEAQRRTHVRRLYEEENSLNTVIFLNADGTQTMYVFDYPVKYVDQNGTVRDITLEIADSKTSGFKYQSADNPAITTFSAQFKDGIRLQGNGVNICLAPMLSAANTDAATRTASAIASPEAQRIDEKTVSYQYSAKTTVEYSLTYTGFKEDIVVSEYTGQTEYPFRLYTNGLKLEEISGSYFLVDDKGNIQASIGDIIIFTADERNNAFGEIVPTTIVENEEYLLNIVVDADYLADPKTEYPIRIDPTIEINYNDSGASAIEDITISTNTNFTGSHTSLYIGRRSTEGIARALMRFPGLDLSDLAGATITSASVKVRDMMCESTQLAVNCHVFTGNVWNANSATWANVSPDNYEVVYLSSQTFSWSIGNAASQKHWYSFDITKAVQGWLDGNYVQNKGIIFKVKSSVENGSTVNNRTFGSYNREANKPMLSVTYVREGTNILSTGTYYINNCETGKYINKASTVINGKSGLLSSLSNGIKWVIQPVSGGYVIKNPSDTTKYLGLTSETASSPTLITVSNSAIPEGCIWTITFGGGGGLIKSKFINKYLYMSGSTLYVSATLGTIGTTAYNQRSWRFANITDYGNTSSYESRELTSFSVPSKVIVNIGETKTLSFTKSPTSALWSNAEDFTFTLNSGTSGCISVTQKTGKITGVKPGIATYTVTHKVTGKTATFKVYVDRYTYELTNEFGFSDTAALLIRDVYDRVDTVYPNESVQLRAWRSARILGGIIYDHQEFYKTMFWKELAGNVCTGNEQTYFADTLGFSETQYNGIKQAIENNYRSNNVPDFAHMQMALAGRLAYYTGRNGTIAEGDIVWGEEDLSYFCGWLGDAVIAENGQTTIGNDDYHADLDAENIYRLITQGYTLVNATNAYYASLTSTNTRATTFLSYIDYETVKDKIYEELVDKDLRLMMTLASEQGNMTAYWYYYDLLSDEQYHINIIKGYPDTYDFMCSLRDGRADIADYQ